MSLGAARAAHKPGESRCAGPRPEAMLTAAVRLARTCSTTCERRSSQSPRVTTEQMGAARGPPRQHARARQATSRAARMHARPSRTGLLMRRTSAFIARFALAALVAGACADAASAQATDATWERLAGPVDPPPAVGHQVVHDPLRHRMLLINRGTMDVLWVMSLP